MAILCCTFQLEHRKHYDCSTEERFRFKIFTENKYKIAEHNQMFSAGKVSFKMGLNEYSDMLHHEFTQTMNGYNNTRRQLLRSSNPELTGTTFISPANVQVPDTVDWRNDGAVTAIKNQGHCGSCWAFSATGSLEGQHFRKSKVLVSLSEQNLVDCSGEYNNHGCHGGATHRAFRYIKDNGGIDTEKSYPYEATDNDCNFDKSTIGATVKGFVDLPEGDEEKMKQAVATIGPISVSIDASHKSFHHYSDGVYDEPDCDSENRHHAVLVVGYGTESNDQDYWLVKNSWGTSWGDDGYIKMSRNKDNQCGIASRAIYPLV